ncbi:MAG: hypothetical protein IJW32_01490 [Clostridia bacterium]|nr:hypothetical protein [Clostridia bacterium]
MPILMQKKAKMRRNLIKNSKFSLIFTIFFIILFFLLVINVSDIFSSLITNKNSIFFTQKLEVPSFSIYAVSINDFDNSYQAGEYAKAVKEKGGAGFVYQSGEHFVFVSSYPSLSEAKEIKQNLLDLGYKSRIVNLKVDAILTTYKGNNLQHFLSSVNFFRKAYNTLQIQTISFDKKEASQSQVNSCLAKLLDENINLLNTMQSLSQNQDLPLKQEISVPLKEVKTLLESLLCFAGEDIEYTSKLKQTCLEIVLKNKDLALKINNL